MSFYLWIRQKGVPFEKKFIQFDEENIQEISNTYHAWQSAQSSTSQKVTERSRSATTESIEIDNDDTNHAAGHSELDSESHGYKDIPEYCKSVTLDEVIAKDYSLVPSKYIEFVNRDENIDFDEKMKNLQTEFSELLKQEEQSKQELLTVFKELGYEIKL